MYKIGITNNVKKRMSSIQTSNPNPLSLEYSGKVSNAKELERELHTHFKRQKINREWFRLDSPDVKYVIKKIDEEAYTEFEVKSISSESQARVDNYNRKRRMKTAAPLLPADKIDMLASELAEDFNKE